MREIQGNAKTVRALLKGVKYAIDYYQREYKWQEKQIRELVEDLADKFLDDYRPEHARGRVAEYAHYFLGSIIISKKDGANYIVDGQQRLTSLTLLLILLRNLQKDRPDRVDVDELVISTRYGAKSFNLDVDERAGGMEALFDGTPFDSTDRPESVVNIVQRYQDLDACFPEDLRGDALPYFTDWLLENVHLVEITAYSDDDAYTIFETMNDRGLSLSPTDMLKGYLLANIDDPAKRTQANTRWRDRVHELNDAGKEVEPDFFKAWFRSQYAERIRERRKGARPEDFDRIGTEFHRWLRDAGDDIGLRGSAGFYRLIDRDFDFYSRAYLRLMQASAGLVPGLEHVRYNADHGFTLQYMVLLAPLRPDDPEAVALQKLRLVARYIDILLARRIWNFRSIQYSTMQYAMFIVMRDIRGLAPAALAERLYADLARAEDTLEGAGRLRLHQQNRRAIHLLLARITDYVEQQSGQPSRYLEYTTDTGKSRFEIEHLWANKPERHRDEFRSDWDFEEHRNHIGGLLLLPKSFNASYGDLPYAQKLAHYNSQNLLARSLHPQCYQHNPGFLTFAQRADLPFQALPQFRKAELDERSELYRQIATRIWNPDSLLAEAGP